MGFLLPKVADIRASNRWLIDVFRWVKIVGYIFQREKYGIILAFFYISLLPIKRHLEKNVKLPRSLTSLKSVSK